MAGVAATISPESAVAGIAWTSRDEIVYSVQAGLFRVAATGGDATRIADGRLLHPDALPDGRQVVVTVEHPEAQSSDDYRIAVVNVDNGEIKTIVEGGTFGRYSASGHLLYLRQGSIVAVPFDAVSLATTGPATPVVTGVLNNPAIATGNFTVSPTRTLIYAPGDGSEFKRALIAIAPNGARRVLSEDRRGYTNPCLSPDGTRVAVVVDGPRNSLWMLDVRRGVVSPLTFEANVTAPIWAPDSRRLAVAGEPAVFAPRNIYVLQAEARSPLQRIRTSAIGRPRSSGLRTDRRGSSARSARSRVQIS
jgi:dipeptidyl aminopeptidase/acylaminoacyl peptidase